MKPVLKGVARMSMGNTAPSASPVPRSSAKRGAPYEDLVGISRMICCVTWMVVVGVIFSQIKFFLLGIELN